MLLLLLFSSTFALCATQGTRSQWLYSIEVAIGPAGTRPGPGPVLDARAFPVPVPYLKYVLPAGPISTFTLPK